MTLLCLRFARPISVLVTEGRRGEKANRVVTEGRRGEKVNRSLVYTVLVYKQGSAAFVGQWERVRIAGNHNNVES